MASNDYCCCSMAMVQRTRHIRCSQRDASCFHYLHTPDQSASTQRLEVFEPGGFACT